MLSESLILAKSFVFHSVICILVKQVRTVLSLSIALGTGDLREKRQFVLLRSLTMLWEAG